MKRRSLGIYIAAGSLFAVILAVIVFLVLPRIQLMMGSNDGQTSGGLTAVSPEGTPVPLPLDTAELPENTAIQKVGSLTVTLALSPYPPKGFRPATFDVVLQDEKGQAVSDASVILDLTMPAMPMPSNQVEAIYTDAGLYHGSGRFTMRGLWRIVVIIQRGTEKISAYFDVEL